jgi:hypothetical protein
MTPVEWGLIALAYFVACWLVFRFPTRAAALVIWFVMIWFTPGVFMLNFTYGVFKLSEPKVADDDDGD